MSRVQNNLLIESDSNKAVNEAKRELRFLLIYIHKNDDTDSTRFATETLSSTELIDYLTETRFLVWACSRDLPEGHKVFGALKARRCPFLGVICLRNGRMSLVTRIEGPINAGELIRQLTMCVVDNEAELVAARADREQLNQTQLIRQQQDAAYEESLRLDREKARRKMELEEAARKERDAERLKQEEEAARIQVKLFKNIKTRDRDNSVCFEAYNGAEERIASNSGRDRATRGQLTLGYKTDYQTSDRKSIRTGISQDRSTQRFV